MRAIFNYIISLIYRPKLKNAFIFDIDNRKSKVFSRCILSISIISRRRKRKLMIIIITIIVIVIVIGTVTINVIFISLNSNRSILNIITNTGTIVVVDIYIIVIIVIVVGKRNYLSLGLYNFLSDLLNKLLNLAYLGIC
jgi:hypothetical protein